MYDYISSHKNLLFLKGKKAQREVGDKKEGGNEMERWEEEKLVCLPSF